MMKNFFLASAIAVVANLMVVGDWIIANLLFGKEPGISAFAFVIMAIASIIILFLCGEGYLNENKIQRK